MSARQIRTVAEVKRTKRSAAASLLRSVKEEAQPEAVRVALRPERQSLQFLAKQWWLYARKYVALMFKPRRPFPSYRKPAAERPGMRPIPDQCTIGLASDWGTGTVPAYRVADEMRARSPDITIHMGDVYYSGTREEYATYFLGDDEWPRGRLGTYVLNGNHDMYSGGEGLFDLALPTFEQETSYFCLANKYWRIVGLDTGYYARTFPLLELLLRRWIRLPAANREWLDKVVFGDASDTRPAILLSHHQWFSAFEGGYAGVGKSVMHHLDKVLLWLWGHEHRLAGYAPSGKVRARCIGHGGMPVELGKSPKAGGGLVFYDKRVAGQVDGEPVGFCGFAILQLDGPTLQLDYVDERGVRLLAERWTQGPSGVTGSIIYGSPALTMSPNQSLDSLVSPVT